MQTRNKTVGKNKTTPCDVRKQFEILQNEVRGGRVKYIKKQRVKIQTRWQIIDGSLMRMNSFRVGGELLLGGGREFYCYFGEQMS